MRNIFFNIILLFITSSFLNAQSEPQDYLSADFHKDRRANVKSMMPKNSLAVFFSNPVRNRSNDVDYHYHQDPNFYYLTGLKEPNSVLLLFSESQVENDKTYDEIIFVQFRDSIRERWDGKRLGIKGVKSKLGFEMAYTADKFKEISPEFSKFNSVLFFDFNNDVRDKKSNNEDLYSLIEQFKNMSSYPENFDPEKEKFYDIISLAPEENSANVAQILKSNYRYRLVLNNTFLHQ